MELVRNQNKVGKPEPGCSQPLKAQNQCLCNGVHQSWLQWHWIERCLRVIYDLSVEFAITKNLSSSKKHVASYISLLFSFHSEMRAGSKSAEAMVWWKAIYLFEIYNTIPCYLESSRGNDCSWEEVKGRNCILKAIQSFFRYSSACSIFLLTLVDPNEQMSVSMFWRVHQGQIIDTTNGHKF